MLVRLKTNNDIEGFASAGSVAADIMRTLLETAKPGRSTAELDQVAREACAATRAVPIFFGYRGFPAAICASVNEELVHGIPSDRVLQEGDLLKIDLGVEIDGFIGDIARTIIVGLSPDKLVSDCRTALSHGIAAAKSDGDLGDIGEAIHRTARQNGWQVVLEYGGHGIDRGKLHADPFVENTRMNCRLRLRPGMVLAIEPMFVAGSNARTKVAENGWTVLANGPAAHFEDTIVVTESGPRILTERKEE